jgi:hypothetical protein
MNVFLTNDMITYSVHVTVNRRQYLQNHNIGPRYLPRRWRPKHQRQLDKPFSAACPKVWLLWRTYVTNYPTQAGAETWKKSCAVAGDTCSKRICYKTF